MKLIFFLLGLLTPLLSFSQHGVDANWLPEVELPHPTTSSDLRGFLYSNMAIFSNNKRVVFFREKNNVTKIYYTYSFDGVNWSSPTPFFPLPGVNSLKVVSDQNDNLHLFYRQGPTKLYYSRMDSSFNYIIDSVRIADNPANGSFDGVYPTIDLQNRIHVMWHDGNINTATKSECFYSQSLDDGMSFSAPIQISQNTNRKSAFPRGQYNACSGDTLAICWRDFASAENNWDIHMVVSTDAGLSWSNPTTVNQSPDFQGDPDLVIDPQGRFHLFYHHAPITDNYWGIRVVYGYSDDLGQTWMPSTSFYDNPISDNQRSYLVEGSRYDINNNVLWTFWKEEDLFGLKGGDMMATYSLDRGQTWSTPEYISDHDSISIGFKTAALLPNGRVCVNYESPNYLGSGESRIVYRERQMIALGIDNHEEDDAVIIYPNPTDDIIHINLINHQSIKSIKIYDLSGKLLHTNFNSDTISLGNFNSGIYIVKITTDKGYLISRKIIKN